MIPNLPNNFYNIIFTIGVFLLGYCFIQDSKFGTNGKELSRKFDKINAEYTEKNEMIIDEAKSLKDISSELSKQYEVENPIAFFKGTDILYKQYVGGGKRNDLLLEKELTPRVDTYIQHDEKVKIYNKTVQPTLDQLVEDIKDNRKAKELNRLFVILAGFLIFFGFIGLGYFQNLQDKVLLKQLQEGQTNSDCQSCGKRFNATVQNSTFPDGGRSLYYCTDCFDGSKFTEDDLTVNIALSRYLSNVPKISKSIKRKSKRRVEKLRRWNEGNF